MPFSEHKCSFHDYFNNREQTILSMRRVKRKADELKFPGMVIAAIDMKNFVFF